MMASNELVRFNVGGSIYIFECEGVSFIRIVQKEKCGQSCSFSTDIANHPDSMLAALLRHSESMPSRMVDGGIFINRDGSIFKHVADT